MQDAAPTVPTIDCSSAPESSPADNEDGRFETRVRRGAY